MIYWVSVSSLFDWKFYEFNIYGKFRRQWKWHKHIVAVMECDVNNTPNFTVDVEFVEFSTEKTDDTGYWHPPQIQIEIARKNRKKAIEVKLTYSSISFM